VADFGTLGVVLVFGDQLGASSLFSVTGGQAVFLVTGGVGIVSVTGGSVVRELVGV
jgi:hypothetical protein